MLAGEGLNTFPTRFQNKSYRMGAFRKKPNVSDYNFRRPFDLINLSNAFPDNLIVDFTKDLKSTATKMLNWLIAMCHQDGEISFFNDASIGLTSTPMEVKLYASRLGIEARVKSRKSLHKNIFVQHLSDSGYVRADTGNASLL